jgi:hypothetical protein
MKKVLLSSIATLFLVTGTAHTNDDQAAVVGKKTHDYEVYCFFTRQTEITRQNQDRGVSLLAPMIKRVATK